MIFFREIEFDDAEMILKWRINPLVDQWMLHRVENDLNKQKAWIEMMRSNELSYHWITVSDVHDIAYVKFDELNKDSKSATAGFYIGENLYSFLTINILHSFYIALFIHLGLTSIFADVFDGNKILKIHTFSGYEPYLEKTPIVINHGSSSHLLKRYVLRKEKFLCKHNIKNIPELPMQLWDAKPFAH